MTSNSLRVEASISDILTLCLIGNRPIISLSVFLV